MSIIQLYIYIPKDGKWLKCGQTNNSLGCILKNVELPHLRQIDVDYYHIAKYVKVLIR